MRDLGADAVAYAAAQLESVAHPVWRVLLAGHGDGAIDDPLDITPWVDSVEVGRPLRSANGATITINNEAGQFDPISGIYAAAVRAANATVQIEMGERLAGVATYWRVMTGEIHTNSPRYGSATGLVELEVLDRAKNPFQHIITSPLYGPEGATPTLWTAHEVIIDLFERFYGFTWPGDFNLDVLGNWDLLGGAQFSQEAVAVAAAMCLQPSGYRLWFDYEGRVTSGRLIPVGLPATWAEVPFTLPATSIASIDGPVDTEPTSTRVRVIGGTHPEEMVSIADHSVLGTTHFIFKFDGNNYTIYEANGDVYYAFEVGERFHLHLWFQGAEEVDWRDLCSEVGPIRYNIGDDTAAFWLHLPEVIHTDPASDFYHAGMKRHVVEVSLHVQSIPPPAEIDCEIDVLGHRVEVIHPLVYVQEWSDALIAIWGDNSMSVENPLIQLWDQGALIAEQEMTIATLSHHPVTVTLKRLDLRIEPGDVQPIENPHGADFKMWVRVVSHGAAVGDARTSIEGYVIA
ncbi:MAG TPA: hypothetical protein VMW58_13165 [Anaerolineae bacterium]|nr:hypothetical protein [Anaerolineae bacterium]